MNTMPDAGDNAGMYPPCPLWCTRPRDHDAPARAVAAGALIRREHTAELVSHDQVAYVAMWRADENFVDGPTLIGHPRIEVDSIPSPMSPAEFRRLAGELSRVVGDLADYDLAETQSGALDSETGR